MKTQRGSPFITLATCVAVSAAGVDRLLADSLNLLWSQSYGGLGLADGKGLAVGDGAVYATGRTWTSGSPDDLFLNKYDLAGDPAWSQTWGVATRSDQGFNVALSGNQVHVAGNTRRYTYDNEPDAITLKYDTNGVLDFANSPDGWWTLWTSDGYNGFDYGKVPMLDESGNLYVMGTEEWGYRNTATYVNKYNAGGTIQWHRHYGVSGSPVYCGSAGAVFASGSVYTAGAYCPGGTDVDVQLLKYSTEGALLSDYTWGTATTQEGLDIAVRAGDIYLSGVTGADDDPTGRDLLVLKLHDDGASISFVSSTTFVGPGTDFGWGIDVADGAVYVVGSTIDGSDTDALLLAYDTDLNLLWSYSWGGTGDDSANDIAVQDGILYVAGTLGDEAFVEAYGVVGDLNCDGVVDFRDINPFVLYLSNFTVWQETYTDCPPQNGDINSDGAYSSFADINPFVALLTGR
jgi:hypothetical protein